MFFSETLDVAIGLVVIFLLLSLMLTALLEIIESVLKTRAADLERAITLMIEDPNAAQKQAVEDFYSHPLVYALYNGDYAPSRRSLFFRRESGGQLPSYIPRDVFASVILDLQSQGKAGAGASDVIASYQRLYGTNAAALKTNLESWYDGVMDRAAGWYKRRTQKLLFWIGLTVAVVFNINPIIIAQHLSADQQARKEMVELARATITEQKPQPEQEVPLRPERSPPQLSAREQLSQLDRAIREVGLPIGWNDFAKSRSFPPRGSDLGSWVLPAIVAAVGWIISAVAATLGAPFWFDLLNKLMVIRATVKPKEKSPDEASEDRSQPEAVNGAPRKAGGDGTPPVTGANLAAQPITVADRQADGCLAGYQLPANMVTHDIDLPPATGGIIGRQ